MEFCFLAFQAWKVMEFCVELWKVMENLITLRKIMSCSLLCIMIDKKISLNVFYWIMNNKSWKRWKTSWSIMKFFCNLLKKYEPWIIIFKKTLYQVRPFHCGLVFDSWLLVIIELWRWTPQSFFLLPRELVGWGMLLILIDEVWTKCKINGEISFIFFILSVIHIVAHSFIQSVDYILVSYLVWPSVSWLVHQMISQPVSWVISWLVGQLQTAVGRLVGRSISHPLISFFWFFTVHKIIT